MAARRVLGRCVVHGWFMFTPGVPSSGPAGQGKRDPSHRGSGECTGGRALPAARCSLLAHVRPPARRRALQSHPPAHPAQTPAPASPAGPPRSPGPAGASGCGPAEAGGVEWAGGCGWAGGWRSDARAACQGRPKVGPPACSQPRSLLGSPPPARPRPLPHLLGRLLRERLLGLEVEVGHDVLDLRPVGSIKRRSRRVVGRAPIACTHLVPHHARLPSSNASVRQREQPLTQSQPTPVPPARTSSRVTSVSLDPAYALAIMSSSAGSRRPLAASASICFSAYSSDSTCSGEQQGAGRGVRLASADQQRGRLNALR